MNRQDLPYDAMVDGANKLPESKKCKCGGTLVAFGEALIKSLKCNKCNEFITGVGEEFMSSIYERYDRGERGWIDSTDDTNVTHFEKLSEKTLKLVEGIAYGSFLGEDSYSRDYCIYCNAKYGNYEKFGYSKRTLEENHEEDCFYRLANEILEMSDKILENTENTNEPN